jgi:hypothetical protein
MTRHVGRGPDGSNLLGFLCALGTLACLRSAWPDEKPRLGWTFWEAAWRPVWELARPHTDEELARAAYDVLQRHPEPPGYGLLDPNLHVEPEAFRVFLEQAAQEAHPSSRRDADFGLAYGCEATVQNGRIQDTALRALTGAGHQDFLGSIAKLGTLTTFDHVFGALFRPWSYADPPPSLRWDPADDRRYAYRADNPATSKTRPTVRGANRLAVEALPFFPTAPSGRELVTTGFRHLPAAERGGRTRWLLRWPIWADALPLDVVRSLLTHPGLWAAEDLPSLRALGVVEVYECERISEGQYRNFTPASACLGFRPAFEVVHSAR